jgi:hypothetical protein
MANRRSAVFGICHDRTTADRAVEQLRANGFRSSDVSVLLPEQVGTQDLAHQRATKAPEGAAAGVGAGAVLGGALGWLAGIGAMVIPGVGPFVAAGPIVAALAGLGVGGAVGGVAGALIGFGIPEYEAKRYEGLVHRGGILISIHSDDSDWAKKGKRILEMCGVRDVSTAGEAPGESQQSARA